MPEHPAPTLRNGTRAQPAAAADCVLPKSRKRTIRVKSAASSEAPPTSAPSMSGCGHELGDVGALHRAAVQDPGVRRDALRRTAWPARPRIAPHTSCASSRGGDLAGADRPDRLVGDDRGLDLLGGQAGQRAVGSAPRSARRASPALRTSRCSPTQTIGVMPCLQRRHRLGRHQRVGLAVVLAALGVADHHVLRSPAWPASRRRCRRCRRRRRARRRPARRTGSAACRPAPGSAPSGGR